MLNNDDLTPDEIDVIRQIADEEALIKLSVYFSRPYMDFLNTLAEQERITKSEVWQVVERVGTRFDELVQAVPEIGEHKSILPKV